MEWAAPILMMTSPREIYASEVRKAFGNVSSNPLAAWLYSRIARQEFFYRKSTEAQRGHPWSYSVSAEGVEAILKRLVETESDVTK